MAAKEKALARAEVETARAALAAASGRRRLDLILSARDPAALVRALPAQDLYFTIREIGLADAAPLVPLASLAQFRTFLDLDAWRGGQLDSQRALLWLRAARAGAQRDPRAAAGWQRKLRGIDREVLFAVLRANLIIHDLEDDPDPVTQTDRILPTAEGRYLVEFLPEGPEHAALRGILDDLYAEDAFLAGRLLASLRWELPSELEEEARRFRDARLADLGFPSLEEALSWFARPPTSPAEPAGPPARPAGFFLAALASGALLDRGMDALPPQERAAVEAQVVAAANAVLVADQVDPADSQAVQAAFRAARALLELGIEARLRAEGLPEDGAGAAALLGGTPVKRLFQEGFGRVLSLRWRAERILAAGGAGSREAPLLDPPLGEALSALAARRPLYFPGLETPRGEWGSPGAGAGLPRAFLSSGELARTGAALDLAEALAALARSLGLSAAPAAEPEPRLSTLYLTALADERLGRAFAPLPLSPAELAPAAAALRSLDDARLAGAGEAGELLLALARAKAAELGALEAAGELHPDRVAGLLLVAGG
ncbi:MAG TPA: DUF6178 family protein [Anaeromyxobacter sp.]|nr:DUF6178 family protein [Anaeromyxobacter sp.]